MHAGEWADPWEGALEGWLADAASIPSGSESPIARITLKTLPHWFISMRDSKAELDAYGAENVRRVRLTMKARSADDPAGAQGRRQDLDHIGPSERCREKRSQSARLVKKGQ